MFTARVRADVGAAPLKNALQFVLPSVKIIM